MDAPIIFNFKKILRVDEIKIETDFNKKIILNKIFYENAFISNIVCKM